MNGRMAAGAGLIAVLVLALFLVLRSDDDVDPNAAATTTTQPAPATTGSTPGTTQSTVTTTPDSSPTTTEAPPASSTVVVDPDAPPPLDTAALTDAEEIWSTLLAYHNWAFQHPDEADLDRYLDPRCSCAAFIGEQIGELVANEWREDDEGIVLDRVEVNVQSSDGIVMDVYDRHVEQRIVDADGTVVRTVPERELSRYAVTLVLDADAGWRIFDWQFVSNVGDA